MKIAGCFGKIAFGIWLGSWLIMPPLSSGQELRSRTEPKPKKEKVPKSERISLSKEDKIIQATARKEVAVESERDRWVHTMEAYYPGATGTDARGEIDFGRWFDALSGGQESWSLTAIREKKIKELYLRAAQRLGFRKEPIPRDAFLAYAVQNLQDGQSPPWKSSQLEYNPLDAATKLFDSLDRNRNGLLESSEQSAALKAVAAQYDANGDGVLEYAEYREYFRMRMGDYRESSNSQSSSAPPSPDQQSDPSSKPGRKAIPADLPNWFFELDEDHDGQVGLYEWRSQRPMVEFAAVDRDGDGLLTPFELKTLARNDPQSPYLKRELPSIPSQFVRPGLR